MCVVATDVEIIDVLQVLASQLHHDDSSQCVHQPDTAAVSVCVLSMIVCLHVMAADAESIVGTD